MTGEEIDSKVSELRGQRNSLFEGWRHWVASDLYPSDPSIVRVLDAKDYRITCHFKGFCSLDLNTNTESGFNISTEGYFTNKTADIAELHEASKIFDRVMILLLNPKELAAKYLIEYKKILESKEYKDLKDQIGELYIARQKIADEATRLTLLKRERDNAAKRIVGTILFTNKRVGYRDVGHLEMGIVTHVTPTKVKMFHSTFYDEYEGDALIRSAEDKGREYLQHYRDTLIKDKKGEWVKNDWLSVYEIFQ